MLRLVMIGLNSAGYNDMRDFATGTALFRAGEQKLFSIPSGTLRPLAYLCIRSVYELCQEETVFSDSIYSATDCVVTKNAKPFYWHDHGIEYALKAEGTAEIKDLYARRIGDDVTDAFYRVRTEATVRGGTLHSMAKVRQSRYLDPAAYVHTKILELGYGKENA